MITQAEIYRAYMNGDDIHAIIQRRLRLQAAIGVGVLVPLILVGLYLVKSAMGVDLMPGVHAWELFTM